MDWAPLTADHWHELEKLFGERGAYGGCWCMWWRSSRKAFEQCQGEQNRQAFKQVVDNGEVPGLLGFIEGAPVAWCAITPRENLESLGRSRVLKPLDEKPVWSLTCFYIDKHHRGEGLAAQMIEAAKSWVRSQGGSIMEAYPSVPKNGHMPPVNSFMGIPVLFERAGFELSASPSASKQVWRCYLD